jgi:ribonucleoside-triphosphate reductase
MEKAGFAYEKIAADERRDLVERYGVKGAPTLVISDGVNFEKYYGVPEIKRFLASEKAV